MSFEITALAQNDRPEVSASLEGLRYLVFRGKKGDDGVSPEVEIEDSNGKLCVTVKDAKGTKTVELDSWKGMRFTIPDGTTRIDNSAFFGCVGLMGVTIPDGVTSIGNYAFAGCSSLREIYLPDSVTKVGHGVFQECNSLESVRLPVSGCLCDLTIGTECKLHTIGPETGDYNIKLATGIESVPEYAFFDLSSLTGAVIPDSVTSIGDAAFQDCVNLESIVLPDAVESIGQFAFSRCEKLTEISVPGSVETIDIGAFARCTGLVSVNLPAGLESVSESLFFQCSALESVSIPNSVASIGISAFGDCTSLEEITASGVTTIDGEVSDCGAFFNCAALESAQFGSVGTSVESVGGKAFEGCTNQGLVITVYTVSDYLSDVLTNIRAGATNATIIIKAAADTTYNGTSYSAGDTILTSNP